METSLPFITELYARKYALDSAFRISDEPDENLPSGMIGPAFKKKPLKTILEDADKIYEWVTTNLKK